MENYSVNQGKYDFDIDMEWAKVRHHYGKDSRSLYFKIRRRLCYAKRQKVKESVECLYRRIVVNTTKMFYNHPTKKTMTLI